MATNSGNSLTVIRNELRQMTNQFAMVMPPETVDRFQRVFMTMLTEKPDLQRCNPRSLILCAMRAAQDGLDLDGREAACVPFKDDKLGLIAQYVPMVLGIRKKVRQTGFIADWSVHVVFEGDDFDYQLGDRPFIHHKPSLKGGRTRPVIAAYSIATFKDGTRSYEVMNIDEIEDVRTKSKAKHGPWHDKIFYPEMCKKTVARLHSKQLPQSSDLVAMFQREDDADGALPPPTSAPPLPPRTVASTLDDFGSAHEPAALSAPPAAHDNTAGLEMSESSAETPPTPDSAPPYDDSDDQSPGDDDLPTQEQVGDAMSRAPLARSLADAYERGRQAKQRGHARKALPPEYRDDKHTREQIAWQAGYDGSPQPEFPA